MLKVMTKIFKKVREVNEQISNHDLLIYPYTHVITWNISETLDRRLIDILLDPKVSATYDERGLVDESLIFLEGVREFILRHYRSARMRFYMTTLEKHSRFTDVK